LSHSTSLLLGGLSIFEIGSQELFAQAALNPDPPDFCLLSSWDYRREPPAPCSCGTSIPHIHITQWTGKLTQQLKREATAV
jgi:hypothetical protein